MQICAPVFGLTLIWLLHVVGEKDIGSIFEQHEFTAIPYIFGMNYIPIVNLIQAVGLSMDNCDRWFFTDYASNATQETKDYWGANSGDPW